jgi:hypothetical protein
MQGFMVQISYPVFIIFGNRSRGAGDDESIA